MNSIDYTALRNISEEAFPIERGHCKPITKPADVVYLAREIVKEGAVCSILERVGEHLVLTDEEFYHLSVALIRVGHAYKHKPGHHGDNIRLSLVLARYFVRGSIAIDDTEKAQSFARSRMRTLQWSENLTRGGARMKLSEMVEIMESFKLNATELMSAMAEIRHAIKQDVVKLPTGPKYEDLSERIGIWLEYIAFNVYGLMNRAWYDISASETFFSGYCYENTPPELTAEALVEMLRRPLFMKRYERPGLKDYDLDLTRYIDDWPNG